METGGAVGVGNDGNGDLVADDGGYGQADAFDSDRALFYDVAGERVGDGETELPVGGIGGVGGDGLEGEEGACAIDMALDDVSAEGRAGGCGEFEVDDRLRVQQRECGPGDGLGGEIGGEARRESIGLDVESCEARLRVLLAWRQT